MPLFVPDYLKWISIYKIFWRFQVNLSRDKVVEKMINKLMILGILTMVVSSARAEEGNALDCVIEPHDVVEISSPVPRYSRSGQC